MNVIAVSITFWFLFAIIAVLLYFVRKQKDLIVKTTIEAVTHKEQREYWFMKHNIIRERLLMTASEVKGIERNFVKKLIGTHTAVNKLTAIVEKMANDEFRDQYIMDVTEIREKHEQEARDKAAQHKLDVARRKAHQIDLKTAKIAESKSSTAENE